MFKLVFWATSVARSLNLNWLTHSFRCASPISHQMRQSERDLACKFRTFEFVWMWLWVTVCMRMWADVVYAGISACINVCIGTCTSCLHIFHNVPTFFLPENFQQFQEPKFIARQKIGIHFMIRCSSVMLRTLIH